MALKQQLEQCSIDFTQKQPEMAKIFCEFTEQLRESKILDAVLREGDYSPDFALPNINEQVVKMDDLFQDGKLVVIFYRGGWCPYCSLELQAWQGLYGDFRAKKVNIVAISPEKAEVSSMSNSNNNLSFEVLSDQGNEVARKFGLVFRLTGGMIDLYAKLGIDLVSVNGDNSGELPIPATYVIGKDRKILDAYIDVDYRVRKDPQEILDVI